MKTVVTLFALILFVLVFPLVDTGVFAEPIGPEGLPLFAAIEPVNMILFGIGLLFAGTRA